jgi:hypothetical protein
MQRLVIGIVVMALGVSMTLAISACGGDDETTTVTQPEEQAKTQTQTQGQATTGTTTTTTGTQSVADCGQNQVLSRDSGTCVDIRQGSNPCPSGETPMADRPVCVPKE